MQYADRNDSQQISFKRHPSLRSNRYRDISMQVHNTNKSYYFVESFSDFSYYHFMPTFSD